MLTLNIPLTQKLKAKGGIDRGLLKMGGKSRIAELLIVKMGS